MRYNLIFLPLRASAWVWLVLVVCSFCPQAVYADAAAAKREWSLAYQALERAVQAETDQDISKALEGYRMAHNRFRTVRKRYPEWNPALVRFRIRATTRKIVELERQVEALQGELTAGELQRVLQERDEALDALRKQYEDTKYRLRLRSEALERAREEAARSVLRMGILEAEARAAHGVVQGDTRVREQLGQAHRQLDRANREKRHLQRDLAEAREELRVRDASGIPLVQEQQRYLETFRSLRRELTAREDRIVALERRVESQRELLARQERELAGSRTPHTAPPGTGPEPAGDADGESTPDVARLKELLAAERRRARALEMALQEATVPDVADSANPSAPEPPAPAPGTPRSEVRERARHFLARAVEAEREGNMEAAVWNYRKVLEVDPRDSTALQRLGMIAAETGNEEDAQQYLEQAFRIDPDDQTVLVTLGFSLARGEKPYKAVSMLARAAALYPDQVAPHRALGVAASSLGWYDVAERELRRAVQLDPADSESAFNLAILLASRNPNDLSEARTLYFTARKLSGEADPELDRLFEWTEGETNATPPPQKTDG